MAQQQFVNGEAGSTNRAKKNANALDSLSKSDLTEQPVAGVVDFEAGIKNPGVTVEPPVQGTDQVTAVPDGSGSITLTSVDDLGHRENNKDVRVNGLLIVDSVSSPVGNFITIGTLTFSSGATNDFRSVASVVWFDVSTGDRTVLPATMFALANDFQIYIDASLIEAGDQFQISLNYGTA